MTSTTYLWLLQSSSFSLRTFIFFDKLIATESVFDDVSAAFQLRRYAWSAKLPLSILTDFEEFAVQRTIDRIIFLRICEDRGIENYGTLMALLNGERVYPRLRELFHRADERYNSGIFHFQKERDRREEPDELTLGLQIDDRQLKDIIRSLYYPESPYEFSVLPADILGQVYEQFLGKVIRLTANMNYLMGILNSRLFVFIYRLLSFEDGRVLAQVKSTLLNQLPIRALDFSDPTDKSRHHRMVALVERMLELHKQKAAAKIAHEQTALQRLIDATDRQIDQLVYELFGLSEEEIKIVERRE